MRQHILGCIIIFGSWGVGDLLHRLTPWPLPGSITGLLLLSTGLFSGLIRLEWVEGAARWLLDHLVLFLIPAVVGVIQYQQLLRAHWPIITVTLVASWACVVLVAVYVARRTNMKSDIT